MLFTIYDCECCFCRFRRDLGLNFHFSGGDLGKRRSLDFGRAEKISAQAENDFGRAEDYFGRAENHFGPDRSRNGRQIPGGI